MGGGVSVLDVGCGQGTQAIRLARKGCAVLGVGPSPELLEQLTANARSAVVEVRTPLGNIDDLSALLGDQKFDVVCAHGLLMYLQDPDTAITSLAQRVATGGLLSLTFRNAAALAFRPGMRRHWRATLDAFDADGYRNELGIDARAHHRDSITAMLAASGFVVEGWYGVRVFTDPAPADEPADTADLDMLVRAEEQAGRRDPYRWLASQIHVLARLTGET